MIEVISEIGAIQKYLERRGSLVTDVVFNSGGMITTNPNDFTTVGKEDGLDQRDSYFFGNVDIRAILNGTIVLTNVNSLDLSFTTDLKGRSEPYNPYVSLAIGNGLNLMGNGTYLGVKRLYGMGFNKCQVLLPSAGAATMYVNVNWVGYLFKMK